MQFDFKAEMTRRTDDELIGILTIEKDNYLPEALTAATEELKKRNLETEKIGSVIKDLVEKKELENKKSKEPLDTGIKIATFLLPAVITVFLSGYYKAGGYDKKARDLVIWTLYGFCFYIVVIVLTFVL